MHKTLLIIFILFLAPIPSVNAQSKGRVYYEKDYQNYWCSANYGKTEYILDDKTRIDCLTENYAVEMDFANKWAESIGQSLYYAARTEKMPGVVLIVEDYQKDSKYLKRLLTVAKPYNIIVWMVEPNDVGKWKQKPIR